MGFFRIMKSTSRNSLRLRFLLFIMIILFSTLCISITKYFFTDHLEIPPNGIEIQACGETQFHYQELSSSKRTLFSHNHRSLRYTIIGDVPKIRPPLFHDESEFCTDRISNQIKFMEEYASQLQTSGQLSQLPVITFLGMSGINSPSLGEIGPGSKKFAGCPIDRCQVTGNISQVDSADVLLWDNYPYYPPLRKPRNPAQIWLMHFFESPYSTPNLRSFRDQLNLTAGFRLDSDIPVPYDMYV